MRQNVVKGEVDVRPHRLEDVGHLAFCVQRLWNDSSDRPSNLNDIHLSVEHEMKWTNSAERLGGEQFF